VLGSAGVGQARVLARRQAGLVWPARWTSAGKRPAVALFSFRTHYPPSGWIGPHRLLRLLSNAPSLANSRIWKHANRVPRSS